MACLQCSAHFNQCHVPCCGPLSGGAVKRQAELFFPAEFADDFPVSLQISDRFGLIYVITKLGLLFVYDLETATAVYRNRISPDPIFLACNSEATGGFYAINRWVGARPSLTRNRGHDWSLSLSWPQQCTCSPSPYTDTNNRKEGNPAWPEWRLQPCFGP